MSRFGFSALLGAASLLALSSVANATLQIAFSNGSSTFFCADQTSCDLDGQVKNLLLLNTVVGNIKIEGTFAASTSHPNELSVSNLTITNLSGTSQTLDMAVGDTGFLSPAAFIRSSASLTFTNDTGGSGVLSFFADKADTQPAVTASDLPGSLLFSTMETVSASPDSFSGTKDSPFLASGAFSMAEGAALTLGPGASVTGFNEAMQSGIPEPKTWAMLVLGFGIMSLMAGFKRKREARFAI